jgi:hypothetical protein
MILVDGKCIPRRIEVFETFRINVSQNCSQSLLAVDYLSIRFQSRQAGLLFTQKNNRHWQAADDRIDQKRLRTKFPNWPALKTWAQYERISSLPG